MRIHRESWKEAAANVSNIRLMVTAAMMCAIYVAVSALYIPVAQNIRVMFTYIPSGFTGLICGPVLGGMMGFVSDIIGYFLHPTGAFFPGYTLSAILCGVIYGIALHKERITLMRVAIARLIVNLFVNVLLGSFWNAMLYGKAWTIAASASLLKNMVLWIPESVVLWALFSLVGPLLVKLRLLSKAEAWKLI